MTIDIRSEITAADSVLREAEARISATTDLRASIQEIVGHGEAADGRVVAEYRAGEGLSRLDFDPRVMKMASQDLAAAVKEALRLATEDLRAQVAEAVGSAGLPTMTPEQMREQLAGVRERFLGANRAAADQLDRVARMRPS